MDLYGDYLKQVQQAKPANGSTPAAQSGWAKPKAAAPSMFKPTSVNRAQQQQQQQPAKASGGTAGGAAGGKAAPKKAKVTAFRPRTLNKKVVKSPTLAPAKAKTVPPPLRSSTAPSTHDAFDLHILDEYDPQDPNDYEALLDERERKKKQIAHERRMKMEVEENERERKRLREEREDQARQIASGDATAIAAVAAAGRGGGRGRGRTMTMPAWMTRGAGSAAPAAQDSKPPPSPPQPGQFDPATGESPEHASPVAEAGSAPSMSFAERMMAKMGYKKGKGLGKHATGIISALKHKKTGAKSGTILAPKVDPTAKRPNPSRVVVLTNMVGPGEVDAELQSETQDECTKFGPVRSVVVHEAPHGSVPDDQAVRIFVEFEGHESALDALTAMGGRFFGGRQVTATLYPEARFLAHDFALR